MESCHIAMWADAGAARTARARSIVKERGEGDELEERYEILDEWKE
jgi:hypothetical protein